jgi:hypothetical protein
MARPNRSGIIDAALLKHVTEHPTDLIPYSDPLRRQPIGGEPAGCRRTRQNLDRYGLLTQGGNHSPNV